MADSLEIARTNAISVETIRKLTEEVWKELGQSDAREAIGLSGIDPDSVDWSQTNPFSVDPSQAGVVDAGLSAVIIGVVAAVGKDILVDLWRALILPRINARFGKSVVKVNPPTDAPAATPPKS